MKRKLFRSPAEITGIIILAVSAIVFPFNNLLSALILLVFIILCVTACFFPQTNFFLPVISHGDTSENAVALTFDDGPAEPTTRQVLDLLDKYSVKATFFVSGLQAQRYPDIIRDIVCRGHSIGNHSLSHNPFLMLTGFNNLYREISDAQEILKKMGINALAFRPPVGIVNPKLAAVLDKLGLFCVTFSCRANDFGNLRIKDLGSKIIKKVKAGDIIVLHDVPPSRKQYNAVLLAEIELLLAGIRDKGLNIVPLSNLIGKEIMNSIL